MKRETQVILTDGERVELTRLMFQSPTCTSVARDILTAVDDGILPPPESIEWFISRFRTGDRK